MSKYKWPLAKKDKDGCPAMWLSWQAFLAIRDGLINRYVICRRSHGRSSARIACGKPDKILDCLRSDLRDAETALEIYTLAYNFNVRPKDKANYPELYMSPAELVALGDKREQQAYNSTVNELWEGPVSAEHPRPL